MPPPGCPPNQLFVPEGLRSDVIQWGHCSNLACHPGVNHTSFLVKQRFWRPRMARDIHSFVLACSVCATGKTRPPNGLLQPLPVPSRPWSHIALDHRPPALSGQHGSFDHGGPVLEGDPFQSLAQITLSQGDSVDSRKPRLSLTWPSGGRGFQQGTPVCVQILARIL